MTYCLAIKIKQGLIAIADSRLVTGQEVSRVTKLQTFSAPHGSFFIMASGLRSAFEKSMKYFHAHTKEDRTQLYQLVNLLGKMLQRTSLEDKKQVLDSGLSWNTHILVGGQLKDDAQQSIFLIYPEGNWIEISHDQSFQVIGNSKFGKPILTRLITHGSSIIDAMKAGIISFDDTVQHVNDVDYPVDIVTLSNGSNHFHMYNFKRNDIAPLSTLWTSGLHDQLESLTLPLDDDF